ncbi:MAG: endonuclease/exonuclease/phosphatase family protein [Planctomycetota bacterium]
MRQLHRSAVGTRSVQLIATAGLAVAAMIVSACASDSSSQRRVRTVAAAGASAGDPLARADAFVPDANGIVLDGWVGEWPADAEAVADERWLYLRANVEGFNAALQAAPETLEFWLDTDADPATGHRHDSPDTPAVAAALGVDLIVAFSPNTPTGAGRGADVFAVSPMGSRESLGQGEYQLGIAPSYAADWVEIRLARQAATPANSSDLNKAGQATGLAVLRDANGTIVGWSGFDEATGEDRPFRVELPAFSDANAATPIPAKPDDAIRVVSWNVLFGSPVENAAPFARVIEALDPDVVLLQEWTVDSADEIRSWLSANLTEMLGPDESWSAAMTGAWGVGVASPHPMVMTEGAAIDAISGDGLLRMVPVIVDTPAGQIAAATVHLKCCGSADSREDRQRVEEAAAIRDYLAVTFDEAAAPTLVVGGDLNLVGSRAPLDTLINGSMHGGHDLDVVPLASLGEGDSLTWRDANSQFAAGRLDWMMTGSASTDLVNAFIFDTSRLDAASLALVGVQPTDTDVSDHLPLVVDVRPRR